MRTIITLVACVVGASAASPTLGRNWLDLDQLRRTTDRETKTSWNLPPYFETGISAPSTEIETALSKDLVLADRLELAKNELKSYEHLTDDWDGNDGRAATWGDIADAITFLDRLPAGFSIPTPMLASSGEVGLYWDATDFYADAAFEGEGTISLFTKHKTTGEKHLTKVEKLQDLTKDWFADHLSLTMRV
ncbi:hypothetical protein LDP08_06020 [Ralstonia pseudosolanacearum]|uniref:hypothetical protein n=1 Tax=Ralstonia pseudosolanacearum TaxID=1310165 RepID=UPI003CF5A27D